MNVFLKNLQVVLLLGSIMLFPSFILGAMSSGKTIELRIEDFLLVFFGLAGLIYFLVSGKFKIKKPPFFVPILVWMLSQFFGVLLNILFGNLIFADRAWFYFFKEVEIAFLYFFVFYNLESIKSVKIVTRFILLFTTFNVAYVFYQIISHKEMGEYKGITTAALCEYGIFPTGAFFVLLFIFLTIFSIFYYNNTGNKLWKKILVSLVAVSPVVGVFGSGSKTDFMALFVSSIFIFLMFFFGRRVPIKKIIFTTFFAIIIFSVFFMYSAANIELATQRITDIFGFDKLFSSYKADRLSYLGPDLKSIIYKFGQQPLFILFGFGVGYITEAHNQFLRNFSEIGIIGSVAFLGMIYFMLKMGLTVFLRNKDAFSATAGASIFVLTLAMMVFSFASDPFFSVKTATTYWFFMAINAAVLSVAEDKKDALIMSSDMIR